MYLAFDVRRMGSHTFFVSLDFGTYASGFAYAALNSEVVTYWNYVGAPRPYPKNITSLLYERKPNGVFGSPKAWGWDARVQYMRMKAEEKGRHVFEENFKLSLAPADGEYKNIFKPRVDLSADKLIADYLRELANMAKTELSAR